jgi:hypothetical protein
MKKEWVDFKAVKEAVTMQMVLDHYGIRNLRKSGRITRPMPVTQRLGSKQKLQREHKQECFQMFRSGLRCSR